ncbi:ATP-binding protein [Patescibacteria group bacterium]|nr:ATP-binding protein [Patescibacteria group bacterium]
MIFPKPHIDLMTQKELEKMVKTLVQNKQPESIELDYKAILNLKDKAELAKDISSFANVIGGLLIYGIPEEEKELPDGTKVKIPSNNYGIFSQKEATTRLQQILNSNIRPTLPELRIKEVNITKDEVVYMIWHPQSFMAPHMANLKKKYYKRGEGEAVSMEEYEIKNLYERRLMAKKEAELFFEEEYFGAENLIHVHKGIRTTIAFSPLYQLGDFINFSDLKEYMSCELLVRLFTCWRPFGRGQTLESPSDTWRIYNNGAISRALTIAHTQDNDAQIIIELRELLDKIAELIKFANKFYEKNNYFMPLIFHLKAYNHGFNKFEPKFKYDFKPIFFYYKDYQLESIVSSNPDLPVDPKYKDFIFKKEFSAADIIIEPQKVMDDIAKSLFEYMSLSKPLYVPQINIIELFY